MGPQSPALRLAACVQQRAARRGALDHLKLQKLCFYAYGVALGLDVANELGEVTFEAWKHGPVNRLVWDEFKAHKAEPLPPPGVVTDYESASLRSVLDDVIDVYGRMSSWSLRCESHLEVPWQRAVLEQRPLTRVEIEAHFRRKLTPGCVTLPTYLSGAQSAALDGIPAARFESFQAIAAGLRAYPLAS